MTSVPAVPEGAFHATMGISSVAKEPLAKELAEWYHATHGVLGPRHLHYNPQNINSASPVSDPQTSEPGYYQHKWLFLLLKYWTYSWRYAAWKLKIGKPTCRTQHTALHIALCEKHLNAFVLWQKPWAERVTLVLKPAPMLIPSTRLFSASPIWHL